jgi:glycerophosphoryl diester phosphodiesterase
MRVIAHRGASGTCPENTLAAFERAAALGADMIELDVQLTRDREVVVIHDRTLERTTDGSGPVAARTLADLGRLDAGGWFGPEFAGERVPTLAEVLACVALPVNVELKPIGGDGLEERALGVVGARDLGRVVFSCFALEPLLRLRKLSPEAAIAVLWDSGSMADALRCANSVGARALHLRKEGVRREGVAQAVAAGLAVRVWTVNEQGESACLESLGVEAIFTDYPERFLHSVRRA